MRCCRYGCEDDNPEHKFCNKHGVELMEIANIKVFDKYSTILKYYNQYNYPKYFHMGCHCGDGYAHIGNVFDKQFYHCGCGLRIQIK